MHSPIDTMAAKAKNAQYHAVGSAIMDYECPFGKSAGFGSTGVQSKQQVSKGSQMKSDYIPAEKNAPAKCLNSAQALRSDQSAPRQCTLRLKDLRMIMLQKANGGNDSELIGLVEEDVSGTLKIGISKDAVRVLITTADGSNCLNPLARKDMKYFRHASIDDEGEEVLIMKFPMQDGHTFTFKLPCKFSMHCFSLARALLCATL